MGPINTEVARQGDDGIFRRVTDFKLDEMGEDVLRSLREIAATEAAPIRRTQVTKDVDEQNAYD